MGTAGSLGTKLSFPPWGGCASTWGEGSCAWGRGACGNSVVCLIIWGYDPHGNVVAMGKSFVKTTVLGKLDHIYFFFYK